MESHILASFSNLDLNSDSYHINVEEGRGERRYMFWAPKMCQLINVNSFHIKFKITLRSSSLPFFFSFFFSVVKTKTINLSNLLKVTNHTWHNLFLNLGLYDSKAKALSVIDSRILIKHLLLVYHYIRLKKFIAIAFAFTEFMRIILLWHNNLVKFFTEFFIIIWE